MKAKSRKTLVENAKVTDQQIRVFILDVVNAADRLVDGSDDYFAQKYRRFFPTLDRDIQLLAQALSRFEDPNQLNRPDPFDQKEATGMLCRSVIRELRDRVRAVWLAEYDDVAEWRICMLQLHAHRSTNFEDPRSSNLYPPLPHTPIELAINLVRRNLLMLRVCRNPDCLRPFFIASAGQQRFCSDTCSAIAQKAHKRRWWAKVKGSQSYKRQSQASPIGGETMAKSTEPCVNTRPGARIVKRKHYRISGGESERTLKRFLHNVVNAPDNQIDHLLSVYSKFFPLETRTERFFAGSATLRDAFDVEGLKKREKRETIHQLREGLQSVWNAEDPGTARWRLFTLHSKVHRSSDPVLYRSDEESYQLHPPLLNRPVNQALALLRRNLHLLRKCSNTACKTNPFFIAGISSQLYCSVNCTTAIQQEYKTRWWKERGSQWRESRPAKKKSSKNTRQKP